MTTANSTNIWTYWRHRCTGHMNEEKNISSRQALDTCHRRNWFILLVFIIGKHNPQLEKSTSCPGRLLAATQWRVSQDSQVAVSACAWCDYPGIDMSHTTQYTQQIHFCTTCHNNTYNTCHTHLKFCMHTRSYLTMKSYYIVNKIAEHTFKNP